MEMRARLGLPVLVLSCGVLAYEISLMRMLLIVSWHHFAFLVVTIALLGFGVSGTALSFASKHLGAWGERGIFTLVLATAVSLPLATALAGSIPVEARFVPVLFWKYAARWILYWTVLSIPFFFGAAAIGLSLIVAGQRLPVVYAANLLGSAIGACVALLAMRVFDPASLGTVTGTIVLGAAFCTRPARSRPGMVLIGAAVFAGIVVVWFSPRELRTDSFKYESYVRQLETDGRAARVASAHSERSVVEVYSGDAFHELAFLSTGAAPPPMYAVTMDGHWAGSILRVKSAADAAVVERTMMSIPYEFTRPEPAVLLLGETGGVNVWLAVRKNARAIHAVQPDKALLRIVRRNLRGDGGQVFDLPGVAVYEQDSRRFVDHAPMRYDLIEPSKLESWAVSTGGVGGLRQDDWMTVEGFSATLGCLAPDGIFAVCRAIQTPPSDNAKIVATIIEALERCGVREPGKHIVIVRDFLAVCTMVKITPWKEDEISKVRRVCAERDITPVYFTGVRDDELNRPDRLPGPPGEPGDWLHLASVELLSGRGREFINGWPFDIRPPTDDRPFFENFGKLQSIPLLRRVYGELWVTRTDLSLLFVLIASVIIAAWGAVMTIIPLAFHTSVRRASRRAVTALFFTAIGMGYMTVEITMLCRVNRLTGDPVLSGAVTITGFLLFSGMGSFVARRIDPARVTAVRRLVLWTAAGSAIVLAISSAAATFAAPLAGYLRIAVALCLIAPLAFLMGFPMPAGLRRVESANAALVPWAWGVNGFASVLAPPVATAVGMMFGFSTAGFSAFVFYFVAALVYGKLSAPDA
jgi:hypothetical protein